MTGWRDQAACRGSTSLFFPPCTHYRQPEGTRCELCGDTVTRPAVERWGPGPATRICETCPVRLECLTEAIRNREHHGIWGGAGGYVLRRMVRARHRVGHDYQPGCDCEACALVTAFLAGERIDGNTPGITHGLPGNRAKGCRCALCVLSGTITGKLLAQAGWTVPDWWATTGLPDDPADPPAVQAARLDRARRIFAMRAAVAIRARLKDTGHDTAWLARQVHGTPGLGPDTVAEIVGYQDLDMPFAPHLNQARATAIVDVLGISLVDLAAASGP